MLHNAAIPLRDVTGSEVMGHDDPDEQAEPEIERVFSLNVIRNPGDRHHSLGLTGLDGDGTALTHQPEFV